MALAVVKETWKGICSMFEIRESPDRGRGIFATQDIPKYTSIEKCPIVLFDVPEGEPHVLECYAFRISKKRIALALGWGSLYNHSYRANCYFDIDLKKRILEIVAYKNIKAGQELYINYGGHPHAKAKMWFDVK